jgi:hypothetical protein
MEAIGTDRWCVAASNVEEAMKLTLSVMEPSSAGPPVGASVDGRWAVGGIDTGKFYCHEI